MDIILTDVHLRPDVISEYLEKAKKEGVEQVNFTWKPRYLKAEVKFSIKI